jgi:hypothetical protein
MKPHFIALAALAAASLIAFAQPKNSLPAPWIMAGKSPSRYEAGKDSDGSQTGSNGAIYLRHANGDTGSWATVMQQFNAEHYRGKRIRFQAEVMTLKVTGWAGLWMRVDSHGQPSAFYNSQDKPITGSTQWATRSVVLDVDNDADTISLGLIGGGSGTSEMRNLRVDVVGKDVPVDHFSNGAPQMNKEPVL